MDALASIVYDVPDRRMRRFGEIKRCLPTPVNRIRKKSSAGQVWLDQAVSCLKKGPSHMHEYSFKQMDPNETETAVGKNFNHNSPYAANSIYYSGLETPITGCPAPRNIITGTGAAVDLIGARDLHNKDKQRKTSEPIHFCTANGTTTSRYYCPILFISLG